MEREKRDRTGAKPFHGDESRIPSKFDGLSDDKSRCTYTLGAFEKQITHLRNQSSAECRRAARVINARSASSVAYDAHALVGSTA